MSDETLQNFNGMKNNKNMIRSHLGFSLNVMKSLDHIAKRLKNGYMLVKRKSKSMNNE